MGLPLYLLSQYGVLVLQGSDFEAQRRSGEPSRRTGAPPPRTGEPALDELRERVIGIVIGNREEVSATDRQHKSLWLSNNNDNNNNKCFQGSLCHAVCVAGGAGFVVCWVGSTFYIWDLPLHASRVAFRVLFG